MYLQRHFFGERSSIPKSCRNKVETGLLIAHGDSTIFQWSQLMFNIGIETKTFFALRAKVEV